ncbi:hypothetical protein F5H01DRAFT_363233 [Linnemannia elongata]|nr:hypothetical protein F5H01DRAFT_363233 [Linnemannia elongata]
MRESEAIKLRVKAMLMRGISTNAIMEQLTMDYARFTRFLERKETKKLSNPTIASPNATFRPNHLEFQADSPTTGLLEDTSRHDEPVPTIFDGCSNTRQRFQFH